MSVLDEVTAIDVNPLQFKCANPHGYGWGVYMRFGDWVAWVKDFVFRSDAIAYAEELAEQHEVDVDIRDSVAIVEAV